MTKSYTIIRRSLFEFFLSYRNYWEVINLLFVLPCTWIYWKLKNYCNFGIILKELKWVASPAKFISCFALSFIAKLDRSCNPLVTCYLRKIWFSPNFLYWVRHEQFAKQSRYQTNVSLNYVSKKGQRIYLEIVYTQLAKGIFSPLGSVQVRNTWKIRSRRHRFTASGNIREERV